MKILLLGDGNFSFSLALVNLIKDARSENNPARIYLGIPRDMPFDSLSFTCTSFDSRQELYEKYPESEAILDALSKCPNVKLLHRINAWELKKHFMGTFDVIIWNHPHLGTEDFRLHRFLMAHFLHSALDVLSPSPLDPAAFAPRICISLVDGQDTRWDLIQQAKNLKLQLLDLIPLLESDFPGYVCKRNKNGQSFKNQHTLNHMRSNMKSFVFRFTRGEETADGDDFAQISETYKDEVSLCESVKAISLDKPADVPVLLFDPVNDKEEKWREKHAPMKKGDLKLKHHVESRIVIHQCPDCYKQFPTLRGIRQHYHATHVLKLYPADPAPLFKCKSCDKMLKKEEDMLQHSISKHSTLEESEEAQIYGVTPSARKERDETVYTFYPCSICGQSVMNAEEGMFMHLESLKPLIGQLMGCPLNCSSTKTFLESRALEQHYKICRYTMMKVKDNVEKDDSCGLR